MKWEAFRQGLVAAALVCFVSAEFARADLLIEKPPARIEVRRDPKLKTSQLILPTIYAVAPQSAPRNKLGSSSTRSSTILSGTAMSAGIALLGFVLLRGRANLKGRILVPLVIGGVAVAAAGFVVANVPPPPPPVPPLPLPVGLHIGDRPVEIVFDPKAEKIVLILDGEARPDGEPTR